MSSRLLRTIATTLIVLLFCGTSVRAGPVSIRQVVLILGEYQNPSKLELSQVTGSRGTRVSDVNASTQEPSAVKQAAGKDSTNEPATVPVIGNAGDSLLSTIAVSPQDPQGTVSVIYQGELEGTICDCGEIIVPGGAFPKWPLAFLGVIPFFFIPHGDNSPPGIIPGVIPTPTPTPTPIPTPVPQVPEPSSLLLLISGLTAFGIGWRRRRIIANRAVEKTGARANA